MRHEFERVEIPGEEEAQAQSWAVLEAAFAERKPAPRRSHSPRGHWPRVAAIAVALAALLASALSPPGQAVIDEIREVVGVERAQRALFALPSSGKLLVSSDAGVWVVQEDGSRRLLGDYREASWSPFGRFVVAARADELAALESDGTVRWTLPRPDVRTARWAGSVVDTRIAYVDRSGLRIVAGDGTGDRLLVRGFAGTIAWRPGERFVLAYATAREINVVDAESGQRLWRQARTGQRPTNLAWSSDGRRLIAVAPRALVVYDNRGAIQYELGPGAAPVSAAALAPSGRSLVFAQQAGRRAQVWVVPRIRPDGSAARRLFAGTATFDQLSWTPEGRWVVVAWPAADQWVFVRANGAGIRAVANVSEQFRSRSFPRIEGWCCAS